MEHIKNCHEAEIFTSPFSSMHTKLQIYEEILNDLIYCCALSTAIQVIQNTAEYHFCVPESAELDPQVVGQQYPVAGPCICDFFD